MKRSGFKKPSYEHALALKLARDERRREKASLKPRKLPKARSGQFPRKRAPLQRSTKPLKRVSKAWSLKNQVWREFSIFIRRRDADENGMVRCCTCGEVVHWKYAHAGHFLPQRRNTILFDERGCNAQCANCNMTLCGNPDAYEKFMLDKYGQTVIDALRAQNNRTVKWLPGELKSMLKHYRQINRGKIDPNREAQLCQ